VEPSRVVVITGASLGLGRAMALGLLEAGHRVVAMGRSQQNLDAFEAEVRGRGWAEQLVSVRGDIRADDQCRRTIDVATERFGAVDVLINNAGFHLEDTAKFYELSEDDWRTSFDTNVTGAFLMTRAAVRPMIARGWGRIVNHQTNYATMLRPGMNPYGPAKAALEVATAAWAAELAGTGVTVNEILPGGAADVERLSVERFPDRSKLVAPAVLVAPIRWLVSDASDEYSGYRIVANRWKPEKSDVDNLRDAAELAAWRGKPG
jgi:NAD(P)-dependent dehydrogenase (short-subunit alcohol dehydrogenase family)